MRVLGSILLAIAVVVTMLTIGCSDKTPFPTDLPKPVYGGIDTNYVLLTPVWTEFDGVALNYPNDVYIGYDQLLYICDTRNDRVIKLSMEGTLLDVYPVVHPVAITQDRGLDLIVVCGDYARVENIGGVDTTIGYGNSVFRKRFRGNQPFAKVLEAPPVVVNGRLERAEFWSVAASFLPTRDYYLTDFWLGRIRQVTASDDVAGDFLDQGIGIGLTTYPLDLCMYQIAGQNYVAMAQGAGNIGVQLFSFPDWVSLHEDIDTLPPMIRFQARGWKDIAVDELSNFYLLLNEPDPLLGTHQYFYKYDRDGELLLSFGSLGSSERQFRDPQGIAYFDGIIYIADSGNNRIVRYQLSTALRE